MVSIIVPVWNASSFLQRCVNSILNQTYTEWELILSNDGSLDNSLEICKEFSCKDNRIVVLDNTHLGVSETRNAALKITKGEYICFVDADDNVEPTYLESLLKHSDADLVVAGYYYDVFAANGEHIAQTEHIQQEEFYDFQDKKGRMQQLFVSGLMHMNWNKLFHNNIIQQAALRFKPYPINEDFVFLMEYLLHCKNLYVIKKPIYHWTKIENTVTGVDSLPRNILAIYNESHSLLRKFFKEQQDIADQVLYYSYELVAIRCLKAMDSGRMSVEIGKQLLREFHENELVSSSLKAHIPKSLPESFFYHLLSWGQFRIYWVLNKLIHQIL